MNKRISPLIVGRGMSGQAMARAISLIRFSPEFDGRVDPPRFLPRGRLPGVDGAEGLPLLCISNPHGLHAATMIEAESKGYSWIVTDKPICTDAGQLAEVRGLRARTWVCHGYRQFWGAKRLQELVAAGEFGRLIAVEGRYWQSSAGQKVVDPQKRKPSWKNDPALSGPFDVALDLAPHWMDLAAFVSGSRIERARGWRSFINAESAHRDTHVHLELALSGGAHAWGSISKTVHGAGNRLELQVIGEKASGEWSVERPDEIIVGRGASRQVELRDGADALGLAPFHGAGWIDGYASVIRSALLEMIGRPSPAAPTLTESVALMEAFFSIDWQG